MKYWIRMFFGTIIIVSLVINYQQLQEINRLKYRIQKLEAGPWKSLFDSKPIFPRPQKNQPEKPKFDNQLTT